MLKGCQGSPALPQGAAHLGGASGGNEQHLACSSIVLIYTDQLVLSSRILHSPKATHSGRQHSAALNSTHVCSGARKLAYSASPCSGS